MDNNVQLHHKENMSTESTLTKTVGSRIRPDVIRQLHHYAAIDNVTPSRFISRLVTQEIARRNAAASIGADHA
jgi:hypothetical protein